MKFLILAILSVLFYILGSHVETAKLLKSNNVAAVSETKTTIDPSPELKPHTEPLTAPKELPTEVAPVKEEKLVQPSIPITPQISTPQKTNEQIAWDRLIAEGFTREQTAGIMGNLKQEHNFRTDGDGLAQWTQGRLAKLLARPNHRDINVQLDYLMEELNGGYAHVKAIIKASGLEGSMLAFQNKYEICGDCREPLRFKYAYEMLGKY